MSRGRFCSVDSPGFNGKVGRGWLSDSKSAKSLPMFGREGTWSCDDPSEVIEPESVGTHELNE